ncbi:BR-signaling kinase 2 [Forsythia ovata]|uniref:BR-signaling kinase 2 n=1 Tax=Forsythia ovata TaxID=205694 RepID=A0ABD1QPD1_9LAMI
MEFGLAELRDATDGFNNELIISESGEKAPNVVYRGKLQSNVLVSVERFLKQSWLDPQQFVDGDPQLSSFGLMKNSRNETIYSNFTPKFLLTGRVIPASVIYSYGTILLDLLTGKHIPPLQITMFAWFSRHCFCYEEKNLSLLMDSSLRGRYRNEDATALVELASKCLQYEARDRPDIKFLFTAVTPLQKEKEVASHVLMGLTKTPEVLPPMLSPLGKACARMYLIAVQDILLKTGYEDEKGVVTKLSFHEWTQVQDRQNIKIFADTAFRGKDFRGAIAYYSTDRSNPGGPEIKPPGTWEASLQFPTK